MFAIKGLDHIVLRTNQMEKMIEFYCDVLGCQIEKQQAGGGLVHIRAGDSLIDLIEADAPINKINQNLLHFCLRIDPFDIDSLKAHFKENQIEVLRSDERFGAKGMGYSFYIEDPEGNEVELCELVS